MTVMPLEESTVKLQVFVTGIEASMNIGTTEHFDKYFHNKILKITIFSLSYGKEFVGKFIIIIFCVLPSFTTNELI